MDNCGIKKEWQIISNNRMSTNVCESGKEQTRIFFFFFLVAGENDERLINQYSFTSHHN